MNIAGIDGCPGGWIAVEGDADGRVTGSHVQTSLESYLLGPDAPTVVAIDIPIGLTDSGPRKCDKEVRKAIQPRGSSVFPAPIRPALAAASRAEAAEVSLIHQGKSVGAQSFAIYAKVRQVDDLLALHPTLKSRIYEIHPELCFAAMRSNGATLEPMAHPKRSLLGMTDRLNALGDLAGSFEVIRSRHPKSKASDDDILDALAALWTAYRISTGTATSIPEEPETDPCGIPMRMWY